MLFVLFERKDGERVNLESRDVLVGTVYVRGQTNVGIHENIYIERKEKEKKRTRHSMRSEDLIVELTEANKRR